MNRKDVLKFIVDNQNERLLDYYDKCYEKLSDLNKRVDRLSLYLIIIVFLYFIASSTTISSVQIGPAIISDVAILLKVIPVLFAFISLQIVVISTQKGELLTIVKMIFFANYKQSINEGDFSNENNSLFVRVLFPFSYSMELSRFNGRKSGIFNSCIGAVLLFPLLSLILLPFCFEYYALKKIWDNYYIDMVGKVSFWLSVWIFMYLIYFVIRNAIDDFQDKKDETA